MSELRWWQRGVIYQLLVPSFLDTDADGLGDLEGVIRRLEYLQWLGVDAVWLSPFHPSPLRELGYDVSDYCDVEPRFGTLETFDRLVEAAHQRNLRVILDWVGNHTSAQHEWFRESRASRHNPRRNWYLWRDARPDGSPPNNWISVFGGSAWQWDAATKQYYLHTFLDSQPDLNWREPAVRAAMRRSMAFWLERGADGFRLDAAALLLKDPQLRDNPPNPSFKAGDLPDSRLEPKHTRCQPGLHEVLAELREAVEGYGADRILLGEFYVPVAELVTFYGGERRALHLPLNLLLTWSKWRPDVIAKTIDEYQRAVPAQAWPTTTIGTHDQPRLAARAKRDQTRVAAMLLLTQRGTPTLYYGDEIGMQGRDIPAEEAVDPQGKRTGKNRDPARTPMQWSGEQHGSFSAVEPWLPMGEDLEIANVADQRADARSLLALYRRLIALRREEPVLIDGVQERLGSEPPVVAYRRVSSERTLIVVLNFDEEPAWHTLEAGQRGHVLASTFLDRERDTAEGRVELRGSEGLVIALG